MDPVEIRQEILSRNITHMKKARALMKQKAVWKLSKSQWDFLTFPLPKEIKDAVAFLELPSSEQQRQIEALEAHLSKYIEDKFAEKRLGHFKTQ
ncbi:hypothetical protein WJX79_007556 [Trebouxia sp. C0005]|nr:MAG: hypothetical protein FRX49_06031 [Trebouxia sp. A1-2]